MSTGNNDKTAVTKAGAELELKNVKCFGCHQKGHVLNDCPEKKAARVIQTDQALAVTSSESTEAAEHRDANPWELLSLTEKTDSEVNTSEESQESWMRVLTTEAEDNSGDGQSAKLVWPTFKVDVQIEGVKTRALLDNGSQVTLE